MIDDDDFPDRTPPGIAASIARRINAGDLAPGDRLPTVRELAAAVGVSPATISAAWQALGRAGLIESRGRAGSFVRETRRDWLSPRVRGLAGHGAALRLDLSRGLPDPALLPDLGPALGRVSERATTTSYQDLPVIPELGRVLVDTWPSTADEITVVDGALDGIGRALEQLVRFGDRVAVESPGFPPIFDLLEALGARVVPLTLDESGVMPASLTRALNLRVRVVVLQPRAQNPTGVSMSLDRARELSRILRSHHDGGDVVVLEDDHSGMISTAPDVSLGRWIPERVVHVRSFSKSHGPDLRIAAVGGPSAIIDRIVARRMLGPAWTSRMLQQILHDLLTDARSIAIVAHARGVYAARQSAITTALRAHGVEVSQPDGINMWLRVDSERSALLRLAAEEIRAASGTPFVVDESTGAAEVGAEGDDYIRVTTGVVASGTDTVAAALAEVLHEPGAPLDTIRPTT